MFKKIGLAVLVGTIATTAFAAPASAHEDDRADGRDSRYSRRVEHDRHNRWGRERAREYGWRDHDQRGVMYRSPGYDRHRDRTW
jgi:hypothetical protein